MPAKTTTKSSGLSTKQKANIQKNICTNVMNVSDVLKSQVMSEVIQQFSKDVDRSKLVKVKASIENIISKHTNLIVDNVLKETE